MNFKIIYPPYSPDLNPIEMVWNEMKNVVRKPFCKVPEKIASAIEVFKFDTRKMSKLYQQNS